MNVTCYRNGDQDLPHCPYSSSCIYKTLCASKSEDQPTPCVDNDKTYHETNLPSRICEICNCLRTNKRHDYRAWVALCGFPVIFAFRKKSYLGFQDWVCKKEFAYQYVEKLLSYQQEKLLKKFDATLICFAYSLLFHAVRFYHIISSIFYAVH
jgi:hypothetical protein